MHFHLISIFPRSFDSYLNESLIKRGVAKKLIKVSVYDIRDNAGNKHNKVDDRPYGGGPGMVLQALPVVKTVEKILKRIGKQKYKILITSPGGKEFTNKLAKTYSAKFNHLIIICGRYEGIDVRIKKILKAEEITIGPYVLTGGELPAMVLVDSVSRQVPGFLGKSESLEEGRSASSELYTRPEVLVYKGKKYPVPKVLLTGDHAKIEDWRKSQL